MTVGVVAIDAKIPNAALMKVSAWHKAQGDTVLLNPGPLDSCDLTYASRQFATYTIPRERDAAEKRMAHLPADVLLGGTGYDPAVRLPMGDLDELMPDYSLYPSTTQSIGRLTRGCPRGCDWCVVGGMDGTRVREVAAIEDFWGGHRVVRLLDDNALAMPDTVLEACVWAAEHRVKLWWDALDIRLLTDPLLAKALWRTCAGELRFAFDRPEHEPAVREGVTLLKSAGASLSHLRFYTLTNFDTTEAEDFHRLDVIRELGVRPFVQCYDTPERPATRRQKRIRRWANLPKLFTSCAFDELEAAS